MPEPKATDATPRSLIVEWANKQDAWVRGAVAEILETRSDLPTERLDHFYGEFLCEKELRSGLVAPAVTLRIPVTSSAVSERLTLLELKEVRNVNRLAEGQEILFNPRITVLFGENASGKTGYVRILKRAAAVRAAEPILPDVGSTGGGAREPEAKIRYKLEKAEDTIDWRGEEGVYPLNRMDVFDSRSTAVYVDEDLAYRYTPGELAFFPITQHAVEAIRRKLEDEIAQRKPRTNTFLQHFPRGSSLYTQIESLGPASDIAALRRLGTVSAEEKQRARELGQELDALRSNAPQAQQRLAESEVKAARSLVALAEAASGFDLDGYGALLQRYSAAKDELAKARTLPLGKLGIPETLRPTWERFVVAGEEYIGAIGGQDRYPASGDSCIYCRQPLLAEAIDVIRQYHTFCDNERRRRVDEVEVELTAHAGRLLKLDLVGGLRVVEEQLARHQGEPTELGLYAALKAETSRLVEMQEAVKGRRRFEEAGLFARVAGLVETLRGRAVAAETLALALTKRIEDRASIVSERQKELDSIKSRMVLEGLFVQIEQHVAEAKWASRAEIHAKRFPALLKSLTDASKLASEELLNRDFERRFLNECAALKAPPVALQFPGRQGQVSRKKSVAADHRPSEVLSEGEQKVIALADVLAEMGLKQSSSPIVFDDPVNSLDYKRLEYVVDRLEKLSEQRQVIIFTHNIWFATEILARFEKTPAECSYFDIQGGTDKTGVVTKGSHPRADTYANIRGSINSLIQAARATAGEPQAALLEKAYEHLRNACEVVVETELLRGVTRRYQPNVMMTKLPEIRCDKLPEAIRAVTEVFDRACRFIGSHSQPLETLNVRPTLEGLQQDWGAIQKVHDELSGKVVAATSKASL